MASVPGSHFVATATGLPVKIFEVPHSSPPPPVPGSFNLEVWTGPASRVPHSPAPGYAGLAVVSDGGHKLSLISGNFAVSDNGTGSDTLNALGDHDTITGGGAGVQLDIYGDNDVAKGGGGNDTINVFGRDDVVTGGGGTDYIKVIGNDDTINGGDGRDAIVAVGSGDSIAGGGGADTITSLGNDNTIVAGSGADTINAIGWGDAITAGQQGSHSTALVNLLGGSDTFVDGPNTYSDTVVGFSQSAGDRIHLTGSDTAASALAHSTQINGGSDTLITLNDGSTILLKGISHISGNFFS